MLFNRMGGRQFVASAVVAVCACAFAKGGDRYASEVADFDLGAGADPTYANPNAALGSPTRFTGEFFGFPSVVSPFSPPFDPDDIVSIGAGGHITLRFDRVIRDAATNLFGVDFIVFANAGFADSNFPNGEIGDSPFVFGAGAEVFVEASVDGLSWSAVETRRLDLFPTLGYLDSGPFDGTPGSVESDFLRAMDPSLTLDDVAGLDYAGLLALYGGSGGGIGFDLAGSGLTEASYLRFTHAGLSGETFQIDAVSVVPAPMTSILMVLGLGTMHRRRRADASRREGVPMRSRPSGTRGPGRVVSAAAIGAALLAPAVLAVPAAGQGWTHYGFRTDRVSARAMGYDPAEPIGGPHWTKATGPSGQPIQFVGQASVVQSGEDVVALGWVGGVFSAIGFHAQNGAARWATAVPSPFVDSWSSPAIDEINGSVLVASGSRLTALSLADGRQLWQVTLQRQVVNASPLVTTGFGPADRAFITDFAYGGQVGRLYCINVDPFDAATNPFQPGELVWSVGVGPMSGASPTLAGSNVVVTTSSGRIVAYPAQVSAPPEPAWDTPNPGGLGLFSGVSTREGAIFAASYSFYGGQTSANLVKLDAQTGQVIWTVPCNRTDSLPIPLADGRVLLSSGIEGFGTHPALQLFADHGTSASLLWDTYLDGGPLVGYWTHTPMVIESISGVYAIASVPPPGDPFGPAPASLVINLSQSPADPGFSFQTLNGVGISAIGPAGRAWGIGAAGLQKFQIPTDDCAADFNGDGTADVFDVTEFLNAYAAGNPSADLTGDGTIDFFDLQLFLTLFGLGCS